MPRFAKRSCRAICFGILLLPRPASAEDRPSQDPAVAALITEALHRNPDLLAAKEAAAAARARPGQARGLPDPMLSIGYTNDGLRPSLGREDMTTLAVMWSQDLPFPGKRGLRGAIEDREADRVEQQVERVRLGVVASVRRAYDDLLLSRGLLRLTDEQEAIWKQVEEGTRARYAVGLGAQQDVLRAQVEVTRVRQRRIEQEAEAVVRLAELNRLLDRPAEQTIETSSVPSLDALELSFDGVLDRGYRESPELKSAGHAIERDRTAVALARKERRPDLTLQAGYMNRGNLDPMWQAGVGVTLPLYAGRKNAQALLEAEARLRSSERASESVKLLLRFRTQERWVRLGAIARTADLYAQGIIPQGQMAVESALANYKSGKLPFVAVLESLTVLYADRGDHLRQVAAHEKLKATIEEWSLEAAQGMASMAPSVGSRPAMTAGMGSAGPSADAMGSGGMR